jgi:hypothetical protein
VTLNTALAAASFIIAVAFGLSTFDRWLRRHRPHELAWTIALGLFAIASLALWWAEARGWSSASFRVFFLFGAVINVPWLALGTEQAALSLNAFWSSADFQLASS